MNYYANNPSRFNIGDDVVVKYIYETNIRKKLIGRNGIVDRVFTHMYNGWNYYGYYVIIEGIKHIDSYFSEHELRLKNTNPRFIDQTNMIRECHICIGAAEFVKKRTNLEDAPTHNSKKRPKNWIDFTSFLTLLINGELYNDDSLCI